MAYVTPDTSRRRIIALGAVGAVHGVMAVALLTGFAGGIIQIPHKEWLKAWTYVPPPTAEPQPIPSTAPQPTGVKARTDTAQPMIPPVDPNIRIDPGTLPPLGSDLGGGLLPPLPPTSPTPTFTPRAAQPLGAPGKWVSDADYPAAALHRGEQGMTGFEVTVGPDGRVRDCRVTRSSGSASLDAATCARVSERARFNPARDEHGDLAPGRYANAIRWRIPE